MHNSFDRLIVVSNRLPYNIEQDVTGQWCIQKGAGGLITALEPVLERCGGIWIGWPGTVLEERVPLEDVLKSVHVSGAESIVPLELTREEKRNFYLGFCNEIIWPLFHDLPSRTNFEPEYWTAFQSVNQKYAETIAQISRPGDFIWVHDYHLMGVAAHLHRLRHPAKRGFFLHIPFPPPQIFAKLPWRTVILEELLKYDLIGFQTRNDQNNFQRTVSTLLEDATVNTNNEHVVIFYDNHCITLGTFPISIDCHDFETMAVSDSVREKVDDLRQGFGPVKIIFGVDRLDYTKGITLKLKAFRDALARYPELRRKVVLVQLVAPSRLDVPEYQALKTTIEQQVCEINGTYGEAGWIPVHYYFRSMSRADVVAHYRVADVGLVTPVKDGMNLVAKEFCISHTEDEGVLILSEFAGSAFQLNDHALLVNPYDCRGLADILRNALTMEYHDRQNKMQAARRRIREEDIFWWVDTYLRSCPRHERYITRHYPGTPESMDQDLREAVHPASSPGHYAPYESDIRKE